MLQRALEDSAVDTTHLRPVDGPSGTAVVLLQPSGTFPFPLRAIPPPPPSPCRFPLVDQPAARSPQPPNPLPTQQPMDGGACHHRGPLAQVSGRSDPRAAASFGHPSMHRALARCAWLLRQYCFALDAFSLDLLLDPFVLAASSNGQGYR